MAVNTLSEQAGQDDRMDGQALYEQLQRKMRTLADEFARGEINRDQFQTIYERYQSQLNMVAHMLAEVESLSLPPTNSNGETIAIRQQLVGKARAMAVYYHSADNLLETLGDFELNLNALRPQLAGQRAAREQGQGSEALTTQCGREWLLFVPGRYTTTVMVFSNEPVVRQIALVEQMHRDFEIANEKALRSGRAQAGELVYPFASFVRRSLRRTGQ
jgi:hypothetical protein